MRRGSAYVAPDTTLPDEPRDSELPQHVQRLAVHRMLSNEWLKVHTSLDLVANTATTQHKPCKDGDPHTTLWEGNEVAARLVLETGRLNVLLKCCVVARDELKQLVRACLQPAPRSPILPSRAATWVIRGSVGDDRSPCQTCISPALPQAMDSSRSSLDAGAVQCGMASGAEAFAAAQGYVKNLGSLLSVVLSHVEAVQTVDLPLLIRHISQVTPAPASASCRHNPSCPAPSTLRYGRRFTISAASSHGPSP
jgi:hypothetical protein